MAAQASSSGAQGRLKQIKGHLQSDNFDNVPLAAPDAIFQLTASYKADTFDKKVDLGVGAYRDDNGEPWVLPVVKRAKQAIAHDDTLNHEYLPIRGMQSLTEASAKLIFGADSKAISEKRVASVQTLSGTGANHLGFLFLARFYAAWLSAPNSQKIVHMSNPTWANHNQIINNVGLIPKMYPYYDPQTIGLDFGGFSNAVKSAAPASVFLLHACAHNPTGIDPSREQWSQLAELFLEKGHFAFFDCAYQGFASGDLDNDAWAVRYFVQKGIPLLVCQSFAKNAGLYGERIGCLNVIGKTKDETDRIFSQLLILQRSEISNPPTFGARIVSLILNDPSYFEQWKEDIATMAHRIIDMRKRLYELLAHELKTPGKWDHITDQIEVDRKAFTGLNAQQAKLMADKAHIYLTSNGRISMAGLNSHNIEYVAQSLDKVVRGQL